MSGRGNPIRRRWALVLAPIAVSLACAAPTSGTTATSPGGDEPAWAIGEKADEICAPEEELCWSAEDAASMRAFLAHQDEVVLGNDPRRSLLFSLDAASELTHKMNAAELEAFERTYAEAERIPEGDFEGALEVVRRVNDGPLRRVTGLYYGAHLVPTGRALGFGDGSADDGDDDGDGDVEDLTVDTEGMAESLRRLREAGPLGEMLIGMYRVSGLLDHDYAVMNALQFGEYDHATGEIVPSGLSRDAKVEEIIRRGQWMAAAIGAASGAIGSIPIAGQFVAIPGELFFIWRVHTKMAFQIAAVYGWDIRRDTELYDISLMLLVRDSLKEMGQTLVSFMIVPALLKQIAARTVGVELSSAVLRKVAFAPLRLLIENVLMRNGREWLVRAATNGTTRSLAGQLIPIIGAVINASIGAIWNWGHTSAVGEHMAVMTRDWLSGLMVEGTTYLADRSARDCAFTALAAIAKADGVLDDREAGLFMAFLAKPYHLDERTTFRLGTRERVAQSRMLADFEPGDRVRCLDDHFEDSRSAHRIALLAHLYAMQVIDLDDHRAEVDVYERMVEELDGDGYFDGEELDESQLEYVERAVFTLLNPTVDLEMRGDDEAEALLAAITPEDTLDFLATPDPATARDFACGYRGECD